MADVDDRQPAVVRLDHPVMGDVAADEDVAAGLGSSGDPRLAGTAIPAATPVTNRPASSGPNVVDAAIISNPTTLSSVPMMTRVRA